MSPQARFRRDIMTSWEEFLEFYRDQLRSYLRFLIQCNCVEDILAKVAAELKGATVPDNFRLRFMVRVMVRKTIDHLRECDDTSSRPLSTATDLSLKAIPARERLVYFLRDTLEYSKRDTSLLIGISDAQVDELLSLARERINMLEEPPCLEMQNANGHDRCSAGFLSR
jgi:DNA-directed RNA polymerase specialized sigma24 family protein